MKNPWAHKRWRGPYSCYDSKRWTPQLCAALKYDPSKAQQSDDGIFWIDWSSVLRFFNTIFLNWNPQLFAYKTVTHALWPQSLGPRNDTYTHGKNPQYQLIVDKTSQSGSIGKASARCPSSYEHLF